MDYACASEQPNITNSLQCPLYQSQSSNIYYTPALTNSTPQLSCIGHNTMTRSPGSVVVDEWAEQASTIVWDTTEDDIAIANIVRNASLDSAEATSSEAKCPTKHNAVAQVSSAQVEDRSPSVPKVDDMTNDSLVGTTEAIGFSRLCELLGTERNTTVSSIDEGDNSSSSQKWIRNSPSQRAEVRSPTKRKREEDIKPSSLDMSATARNSLHMSQMFKVTDSSDEEDSDDEDCVRHGNGLKVPPSRAAAQSLTLSGYTPSAQAPSASHSPTQHPNPNQQEIVLNSLTQASVVEILSSSDEEDDVPVLTRRVTAPKRKTPVPSSKAVIRKSKPIPAYLDLDAEVSSDEDVSSDDETGSDLDNDDEVVISSTNATSSKAGQREVYSEAELLRNTIHELQLSSSKTAARAVEYMRSFV